MRRLIFAVAALCLALPGLAHAQSTGTSVIFPAGWAPGTAPCVKQVDGTCVPVSGNNPLPVTVVNGGSSDASAANQTTQIAAEQAIRDRIGAVTTPAAGSTNALLTTGNTSIGNVDTDLGAPADAAWTSGNGSVIALLKALNGSNAGPLPAGSATIGNVGGLNTPGATMTGGGNRVGGIDGGGLYRDLALSTTGALSTNRPAAVLSATATVANSRVAKASAGSLLGFTGTSTVAGYYLVFDATSAPADGTVTPLDCIAAPNANATIGADYSGAPLAGATGLTIVFSTTGCLTKTASATAFISAKVLP